MTQTQGASKVKYPVPLPLEVTKADDNAKTLTFKLFSNPSDTNSPKGNKTIRVIDGSEEPRTIIQFKVDSRIVSWTQPKHGASHPYDYGPAYDGISIYCIPYGPSPAPNYGTSKA
jgi:hypothetical protein